MYTKCIKLVPFQVNDLKFMSGDDPSSAFAQELVILRSYSECTRLSAEAAALTCIDTFSVETTTSVIPHYQISANTIRKFRILSSSNRAQNEQQCVTTCFVFEISNIHTYLNYSQSRLYVTLNGNR